MRRKIFLVVLLFISIFGMMAIPQSYALPIMPPVHSGDQTLFGENQYYTVTFRGNGEAVVSMKAIITNNKDTNLSTISLHLPPHSTLNDIIGYQVLAKPQCTQYSSEPVAKPSCLQYQPPDYQYVANDTTYQKLSVQEMNGALSFVLPAPIKPTETGSYLLSFRTFDFTQKNIFGAYTFVFQSLQVDDQINQLQVGIATDSDLYIKGAKGTVNYDTNAMKSLAVPQSATGTTQSQRFNDFYNQIGQGTIVKNVSNLAPAESYKTDGMYADSNSKLYGQEITTTIGIVLVLVVLVFGTALFIMKRQKKKKTGNTITNGKLFALTTGISFVSILLASGYTVMVTIFSGILGTNTYYTPDTMIITLLIIALSGAVYLFLLFVPSIIMTIKKGFLWGGVMFGLTIFWAVIAGLLLFGMFYIFSNNSTPTPIVRPLMMSGQAASSSSVMPKAQ